MGGRTSARAKELLAATKKANAAAEVAAYAPPKEPVNLPVHQRLLVDGEGEATSTSTVFCRRRGGATDVSTCASCSHVVSVPAPGDHTAGATGQVRCMMEQAVPHKRDDAEQAMRTYVGEIMRRRVTCVRTDASWETLEDMLLDEDEDAVVVVDAHGRPVGTVTESDMLRYLRDQPPPDPAPATMLERGFHVEPSRQIAHEIMTPVVQTMLENAPISFAIGLLAQKGFAQAPVVGVDGAVVGIVSANEVVCWMAQRLGYEK
jgi:CBS-domain-containing membrane protein